MDYLLIKYIHIISSTILFGTGIGSAFYMLLANLNKDVKTIYFTVRNVVIADWIFTTSSVIVQLITGLMMVNIAQIPIYSGWVFWALCLYFFAGACWLPVVWMQIKMRDMAKEALDKGETELPAKYWLFHKWWVALGALAFPAIVVVLYLMVFQPAL